MIRKLGKYVVWLLLAGVPYGIMLAGALRSPVNWPAAIGLISLPVWYYILRKKIAEYELGQIAILYALATGGVFWALLWVVQNFGE